MTEGSCFFGVGILIKRFIFGILCEFVGSFENKNFQEATQDFVQKVSAGSLSINL